MKPTTEIVCEVCQKKRCSCGSPENTITDEQFKKAKQDLKKPVQKPIDFTKTVNNANR